MESLFFIVRMYVSKVLVAVLLTYVYLNNASPSLEGKLEKSSPAFFAQELESADDAEDQSFNQQDFIEADQE